MRRVDTREPWGIREPLIIRGWEQKPLKYGDFAFTSYDGELIGVTRKVADGDLLTSIGETFSWQLEAMSDFYDIKILLIEGSLRYRNDTGHLITATGTSRHTRKEVMNYILRWQMKGFLDERTASPMDTIERLNELYALFQKPYSLSSRSRKYSDDRVLAFPSGLRGKTGDTILKGKTLREVANMEVDELVEIDGIGIKRAHDAVNHFTKR